MSKRGRSNTLTGGTGDVKPQILTASTGVAGAIDDYVVNVIVLPVPRIGMQKNRAMIMEVLKVWWYLAVDDISDLTGAQWAFLTTNTARFNTQTSTAITMALDALEPNTFAMAGFFRTLSTNGATVTNYPAVVDLTDGNGNGILIATDRIFIIGGNIAGTAGATYTCKILYRMVNVGIEEYVGIVQSQNS